MNSPITGKYIRHPLNETDQKILRNKYYSWLLYGSYGKTIVALLVLLLIGFTIVVPFIPSRFAVGKWSFPSTLEDYVSRVRDPWLIIPAVIIFYFVTLLLRTKIDMSNGTKKKATFLIRKVITFGRYKILYFRSFNFLIVQNKTNHNKDLKSGQLIVVNKTITNKILTYHLLPHS